MRVLYLLTAFLEVKFTRRLRSDRWQLPDPISPAAENNRRCSVSVISMKQLLEAGVHFGHQTRRWNPKMKPYIFTERNGIYIIDLQKTVRKVDEAYAFMRQVGQDGGHVLFIGTKKQAQDAVAEEARRAGQYYINQRWLGGILTNFATIRRRVRRLTDLKQQELEGAWSRLPKKEVSRLTREKNRLETYLAGIEGMRELPQAVFIVDPRKEHIAITEARKIGCPVVAIVDTNCDPDEADYVIPGNDDAIRAVRLLTSRMADAILEGREGRQDEMPDDSMPRVAPHGAVAAESEGPESAPDEDAVVLVTGESGDSEASA